MIEIGETDQEEEVEMDGIVMMTIITDLEEILGMVVEDMVTEGEDMETEITIEVMDLDIIIEDHRIGIETIEMVMMTDGHMVVAEAMIEIMTESMTDINKEDQLT